MAAGGFGLLASFALVLLEENWSGSQSTQTPPRLLGTEALFAYTTTRLVREKPRWLDSRHAAQCERSRVGNVTKEVKVEVQQVGPQAQPVVLQ